MGVYNFDEIIDRRGTGTMKYDALESLFGSADLTPLWIADMEFAVCPEISNALRNRFEHPVYGYAMTPDSYWQSIMRWLDRRHGLKVHREDLAFVPGIVRGIAYVVNFFTDKGDKVVIQPPVYHPFRLIPEGNGRIVVNNNLLAGDDENYYRMDLEGLERIFATEHPKLMILCNPHNPAGVQWDVETLRKVASLARRYGVLVISDEIHGDLMLFGKKHIPFASVSDDAAAVSISFGAPSKTFNIAGLASSWMYIPNDEIHKPFYQWMEANEFSVPGFTATIGTEAAYNYGEPWLEEMLSYLEGNVEAVEQFCAEHIPDIIPVRPQASFLIWLDCRKLGLSQKELVDTFVKKAGLALNDGSMFGPGGEGFMRLNIGMARSELIKALKQLKKAITVPAVI